MAKKIKKAIPWFLVATILMVGLVVGLNVLIKNVNAGSATTGVTVTNSAPEWTVNASESPDSTGASPTNVGSKVYFTAQASDPNGEQWYLAICKVAGAPTPATDGAPTCSGGAGNNWIVCGPYDDDHTIGATECGYTTLVGDAESQAWYGYICDKHAGEAGLCNAAEQSTNDPFKVNRRPTITSVSTTTDNQNPGGTFTITTVASDSDTDTTPDTLTVYVCDENATDGVGCNTGHEICHTSGDASPDVSCDYVDTAPTEDKAYTYYAFIWDNHDFAAADNSKTNNYTVANVAPVVSAVKLNADGAITLTTESSTTNIDVTGTVTDQNGCADIVLASTKADVFITNTRTHETCNQSGENDNNECYAEVTCTQDGGTCTGDGRDDDADADYTCTVSFQYYASPTVENTPEALNKWTAFLNSADDLLPADSVEVGTQVEMNDFVALDVTDSIPYGSLAVGEISGGEALPETTTVTATGNTALDLKLHAEKKMCTDYPDCSEALTPIAQIQQHYAASGTWTAGNALASTLPETAYQLNCKKTTGTAPENPATKDVKWGLQVPDLTLSGSYTGSNTFTAVMGDNPSTEW